MNYIYTLKHPETEEIRYVGKTNNINRRLSQHINTARYKKRTDHLTKWVGSLLKNGLKPTIEILDEINGDWEWLEIYWISQFKIWGFNLVNIGLGGEGVIHTDEVRMKISNSRKYYTHSIETKEKMKNNHRKFNSEESKMKLYKPVNQLTLNGKFIKRWKSIKEAKVKYKYAKISDCVNGKAKTTCGFKWELANNLIN